MIHLLKGWMWQIIIGLAGLSGFLFMLLRLRNAQEKADRMERRARVNNAIVKAERAMEEARRSSEQKLEAEREKIRKRRKSGDPPSGKWGL